MRWKNSKKTIVCELWPQTGPTYTLLIYKSSTNAQIKSKTPYVKPDNRSDRHPITIKWIKTTKRQSSVISDLTQTYSSTPLSPLVFFPTSICFLCIFFSGIHKQITASWICFEWCSGSLWWVYQWEQLYKKWK